MSSKFKKGDKVRIVANNCNHNYCTGEELVIENKVAGGYSIVGRSNGIRDNDAELVEPPKQHIFNDIYVGDVMVRIEGFYEGMKVGDMAEALRLDAGRCVILKGYVGGGHDTVNLRKATKEETEAYYRGVRNISELSDTITTKSLVDQAKERYPIGTRIRCVNGNPPEIFTVKDYNFINNSVTGVFTGMNGWVVLNGKWAEIVSEAEYVPVVGDWVVVLPEDDYYDNSEKGAQKLFKIKSEGHPYQLEFKNGSKNTYTKIRKATQQEIDSVLGGVSSASKNFDSVTVNGKGGGIGKREQTSYSGVNAWPDTVIINCGEGEWALLSEKLKENSKPSQTTNVKLQKPIIIKQKKNDNSIKLY